LMGASAKTDGWLVRGSEQWAGRAGLPTRLTDSRDDGCSFGVRQRNVIVFFLSILF